MTILHAERKWPQQQEIQYDEFIRHAQKLAQIPLGQDTENHLVNMLSAHQRKEHEKGKNGALPERNFQDEFHQALLVENSREKFSLLEGIGNDVLLYCGLFPDRYEDMIGCAETHRKLVVPLGQSAFFIIAQEKEDETFQELGKSYYDMLHVLNAARRSGKAHLHAALAG